MEKEIIEELEEIRKEFNEIKESNFIQEFKNKEFVKLMNTMEDNFRLPCLLKCNERELPEEVITLYQQISDSRAFQ